MRRISVGHLQARRKEARKQTVTRLARRRNVQGNEEGLTQQLKGTDAANGKREESNYNRRATGKGV